MATPIYTSESAVIVASAMLVGTVVATAAVLP